MTLLAWVMTRRTRWLAKDDGSTMVVSHTLLENQSTSQNSLVRYVILAISVAKIDFIVFMASLGVK